MKSVAIIGAGISGLSLANKINNISNVTVFEKSRGLGGRVATRRVGNFSFDHGAQFFKAKSSEFNEYIEPMIEKGIIDIWKARFIEIDHGKVTNSRIWGEESANYIGIPSMSAIGKFMSEGLNIKLSEKIEKIQRNSKWELFTAENETKGQYDWIISTIPPKQTIELIPNIKNIYSNIESHKMLACYSLMLGFDKAIDIDFDAALVKGKDISWISVNSSKPGRGDQYTILAHSTNKWASENIERDRDWVKEYLCGELSKIIDRDISNASYIGLQGWRYANIGKQKGENFYINKEENIALCGDWFIQGRIESAYLSSSRLANKLIQELE
tara:strand:+ start:6812 stop:7795 length:984 start_codon:yes stop_codon:yes gene_type:complete